MNELKKDEQLIANTKYLFNAEYGTLLRGQAEEDKYNIVIASIDAVIDALNKLPPDDVVIFYIEGANSPEVTRHDGRAPATAEEKFNKSVLLKVLENKQFKDVKLVSIQYEDLLKIRSDPDEIWKFMCSERLLD